MIWKGSGLSGAEVALLYMISIESPASDVITGVDHSPTSIVVVATEAKPVAVTTDIHKRYLPLVGLFPRPLDQPANAPVKAPVVKLYVRSFTGKAGTPLLDQSCHL